ncbi:nucleoside deaminase [Nocardia coffeae]|uniref:nucleoside deaminase n=1 Tax=Nocardia coffeae TaxID=2873381 RepID=UPI0027E194BA|nr:nucleoside deaminase [Nocardia coffeae]
MSVPAGSPPPSETPTAARDLEHLRHAIRLSAEAVGDGNHPFGAVLAGPDGTVLSEAKNTVVTDHDCTGHAETNLVRLAGHAYTPEFLRGTTLYASTEPCAMCAGAIYWCGIGRVVFGLAEQDLLRLTGSHPDNLTMALPCREVFARGQRQIEVVGPLLVEEAARAHGGFWAAE